MALSLASRPPVNGRIAIGEKHQEKGYPVKLDYFIFTQEFDPKTKQAPRHKKMTEVMSKKYNTDKPKFIDVTLVNDHPDEVFFTSYMNYPSTKCNCKGDDKFADRKKEDGTYVQVECNYDKCQFKLTKTNKGIVNTCKPTGILNCIIPEAPVSGGIWRFSTHSKMSIGNILNALHTLYTMRGTLYGLKVRLKVKIVQVDINGQTQNVPTVTLEVPFSYNEIAEGAGTTIGTLMDARAKYASLGNSKNPDLIKTLSMEAEKLMEVESEVIEGTIVPPDNPVSSNQPSKPETPETNSGEEEIIL